MDAGTVGAAATAHGHTTPALLSRPRGHGEVLAISAACPRWFATSSSICGGEEQVSSLLADSWAKTSGQLAAAYGQLLLACSFVDRFTGFHTSAESPSRTHGQTEES